MSSSLPKKKVITTSVTCTKVPRPLRNLKLSKKKFSSGNLLESRKSQNSSVLTTSARSISLSGFSFSSTSDPSKVIPPDEYYCESPPSGFGSSESSGRPLTGTPSATETGPSVSATPSSSSAKDSALSITASSSPVGTNTPSSGSTKRKDSLLASSGQLEDDSGQGDFEEELQFSLVSSSSIFDPISNSDETESGSHSYSYTCSNSCCTTGCYSDDDGDDDEDCERSQSTSSSSSRSHTHSKRTISELNDSELGLSDDDTECKEDLDEEGGDSDLEKDREASDKTFELYLKRVEKLKRVLTHWDSFLNENGISRPDFFCRFKERESLQQIVEEFQKITSRHREGLLSALKEDPHRGNAGLGGLDLEDTTSGSSDAKVRRNGWRNRRIRKLLMAGEGESDEDKNIDDGTSCSPFSSTRTNSQKSTPVKDEPVTTPTKKRIAFDYWESKKSSIEERSTSQQAKSATPKKPMSENQSPVTVQELKIGYILKRPLQFRVSGKFGMKSTQTGQVFNFHGIDATGEIAFVAFRNEATKFCDLIDMNACFELENFRVTEESDKFPSGTGNKFQINLVQNSQLTRLEDDKGLPKIPLKIIPLNHVVNHEVKTAIDTIGILITDWGFEYTSTGKPKRDLSITDSTKNTILVTLWGADSEHFTAEDHSVILIRRGVVSMFHGKYSLNCNNTTLVWVDPDIPEALQLRKWFEVADTEEEQTSAK